MHDIKALRTHLEVYRKKFSLRGYDSIIDEIVMLDEKNRAFIKETQDLQAERNQLSKEIGQLMAQQNIANADIIKQQVADIKEKIADIEAEQGKIAEKIYEFLTQTPNLLADDVPVGVDENDNIEIRTHGTKPSFYYPPENHDILAEEFVMDFESAAKISGARFVYLKDELAQLERALGNFMLDLHTEEFAYTEVSPPLLVKENALFGTGQLPKFEEDLFKTDNHYLIPTAEVPLTNLVRETILSEDELPLRFTALTPCFRSEAGSAGKDTRGMIRQHQFSKVELVSIVPPEYSTIEHERMLTCAETVLQRLELPYRVVLLCSGDTGFSAQKTFDIEVWLPGQNKYREISSVSNCGDFQARRMNARYKTKNGDNRFVHTLNGSGLAVGRCLVAILENYQQEDGTVLIPKVLQPYMRGITHLKKHSKPP
jgi:seryl-tRNA synthetase